MTPFANIVFGFSIETVASTVKTRGVEQSLAFNSCVSFKIAGPLRLIQPIFLVKELKGSFPYSLYLHTALHAVTIAGSLDRSSGIIAGRSAGREKMRPSISC